MARAIGAMGVSQHVWGSLRPFLQKSSFCLIHGPHTAVTDNTIGLHGGLAASLY